MLGRGHPLALGLILLSCPYFIQSFWAPESSESSEIESKPSNYWSDLKETLTPDLAGIVTFVEHIFNDIDTYQDSRESSPRIFKRRRFSKLCRCRIKRCAPCLISCPALTKGDKCGEPLCSDECRLKASPPLKHHRSSRKPTVSSTRHPESENPSSHPTKPHSTSSKPQPTNKSKSKYTTTTTTTTSIKPTSTTINSTTSERPSTTVEEVSIPDEQSRTTTTREPSSGVILPDDDDGNVLSDEVDLEPQTETTSELTNEDYAELLEQVENFVDNLGSEKLPRELKRRAVDNISVLTVELARQPQKVRKLDEAIRRLNLKRAAGNESTSVIESRIKPKRRLLLLNLMVIKRLFRSSCASKCRRKRSACRRGCWPCPSKPFCPRYSCCRP